MIILFAVSVPVQLRPLRNAKPLSPGCVVRKAICTQNRNLSILFSSRAVNENGKQSKQKGFGGLLTRFSGRPSDQGLLPSDESLCACGSEKQYGRCCRRFHVAQSQPRLAVELLRSRYSAYAYRLPSYIMSTTHKSTSEFDRRKWKMEILSFCKQYQFVGGVDVIEQTMTGPSTTSILFRYVLTTFSLSFTQKTTLNFKLHEARILEHKFLQERLLSKH